MRKTIRPTDPKHPKDSQSGILSPSGSFTYSFGSFFIVFILFSSQKKCQRRVLLKSISLVSLKNLLEDFFRCLQMASNGFRVVSSPVRR